MACGTAVRGGHNPDAVWSSTADGFVLSFLCGEAPALWPPEKASQSNELIFEGEECRDKRRKESKGIPNKGVSATALLNRKLVLQARREFIVKYETGA